MQNIKFISNWYQTATHIILTLDSNTNLTKEDLQDKTLNNLKEINSSSDKRMFIYNNFFNECKQSQQHGTDPEYE